MGNTFAPFPSFIPTQRRLPCDATTTTAVLSKPRASGGGGYASETHVRRGDRVVHGDKELIEKLGRNDLCPCGSGRRFQKMLPALRPLRRQRAQPLCPRLEHDAEKACPALDAGWAPVFGKHHAPTMNLKRDGVSKKSHPALGLRRVGRAARHRGANATRPKGRAGSTPALSATVSHQAESADTTATAGRSVSDPCGLISRVEPGATPGPATNSTMGNEQGLRLALQAGHAGSVTPVLHQFFRSKPSKVQGAAC